MFVYYINYDRDFCNTYAVFAVAPEDLERFRDLFPDAERITRKRAIERGWTRPREARRDGEYWPGGFARRHAAPAIRVTDAATAIEECKATTREVLDCSRAETKL